jgi:hypothetical protein
MEPRSPAPSSNAVAAAGEGAKRRQGSEPRPDGARRKRGKAALAWPLFLDDAQVVCCICECEVIKSMPWFRCAECAAPQHSPQGFFLCLVCMKKGLEAGPHRNSHAFVVMPSPALHAADSEWCFEDELQLLNAVERCGLGNWDAVAVSVCHCWQRGPAPAPSSSSSLAARARAPQVCDRHSAARCAEHFQRAFVLPQVSPARVEADALRARAMAATDAQLRSTQDRLPVLPGHDVVGYMPLRDCYDVEFLDDAERPLASLVFTANEVDVLHVREAPAPAPAPTPGPLGAAPEALQRKLDLVACFNDKIDERERRKAFVRDRGILAWRERHRAWKRAGVRERELRALLLPLERFSTVQQHEELVLGLVRESELLGLLERFGDQPGAAAALAAAAAKPRDAANAMQLAEREAAVAHMLELQPPLLQDLKRAVLNACVALPRTAADALLAHQAVTLEVLKTGRQFDVKLSAYDLPAREPPASAAARADAAPAPAPADPRGSPARA